MRQSSLSYKSSKPLTECDRQHQIITVSWPLLPVRDPSFRHFLDLNAIVILLPANETERVMVKVVLNYKVSFSQSAFASLPLTWVPPRSDLRTNGAG